MQLLRNIFYRGKEKKMTYGSLAGVKKWLQDVTGTAHDTAITDLLAIIDSFIDNYIGTYTTVPLGSTPAAIAEIANLWAAGAFRVRNIPDGKHPFVDQAREQLYQYIARVYGVKGPPFAKTRGGRTSSGHKP